MTYDYTMAVALTTFPRGRIRVWVCTCADTYGPGWLLTPRWVANVLALADHKLEGSFGGVTVDYRCFPLMPCAHASA